MALKQQFDTSKFVRQLERVTCCPLILVEGLCTKTFEQATTLIFYTEHGVWYRTFYDYEYRNRNYLLMAVVEFAIWFKGCQTV